MFKKFLTIGLIGIAALGLTGCGQPDYPKITETKQIETVSLADGSTVQCVQFGLSSDSKTNSVSCDWSSEQRRLLISSTLSWSKENISDERIY